MRVSQIQNLTWAGNVLVLAGVAWAGIQFWEARKTKAAKEPEWKRATTQAIDRAWPPDIASIAHVWKTPINGVVPPPPEVVVTNKPKVDAITELNKEVKYLGGLEFVGEPSRSIARVSISGQETTISPGQRITVPVDGRPMSFVLVKYTLDSEKHAVRLVFKAPPDTRSLDDKPVDLITLELPDRQTQSITDKDVKPFEKGYSDLVKSGRVTKDGELPSDPWQDPTTGEWTIPVEEQAWLYEWGEKEFYDKLATKPDLDAEGVSHGVRLLGRPEEGTRLATHGIVKDDIIRSINGVAVGSKEDILRYLRGPGKGLEKYEVVVERGDMPDVGKQRTIVYRVPRRR